VAATSEPAWQPTAVLFDFDGTLADSYAAIAASVNHVRAHHGLPRLPEREVRRHVGRGPEHLLRQTIPGGDVPSDLDRYIAPAHPRAASAEAAQLITFDSPPLARSAKDERPTAIDQSRGAHPIRGLSTCTVLNQEVVDQDPP